MGKGGLERSTKKIVLKYQHAQNFKQTKLFYKLLRLV